LKALSQQDSSSSLGNRKLISLYYSDAASFTTKTSFSALCPLQHDVVKSSTFKLSKALYFRPKFLNQTKLQNKDLNRLFKEYI